jgi:hypothetical protein
MGFQPTTAVYERAKTVHELDLTATVVGFLMEYKSVLPCSKNVSVVN